MVASHIHDALAQVKTIREIVLARKFFRGYSGKARIVSGLLALAASAALSSRFVPVTPAAHLAGWGVALLVGLVANYAALAYWFLFNADARRDPIMLKPALDALPALAVGGVLSLALILAGQYDFLFGVWMSLYGLAQVAYRQSLPKGIYIVGICYIACGAYCLLWPGISFTSPLPMGAAFFTGETAGGLILLRYRESTGEGGVT
jgi:hypothetical protein